MSSPPPPPQSANDLLRAARRRQQSSPNTPLPTYYLPNVQLDALKSTVQNTLHLPTQHATQYVQGVYSDTEDMAYDTAKTCCRWLFRVVAALVLLLVTVGMAFTMYCFLYWCIIPTKEYSYHLHFDYGAPPPIQTMVTQHGGLTNGVLSVGYGTATIARPFASVNLLSTHREQWNATALVDNNATVGSRLLLPGQGYTVTVRLVLPESSTNMHRPTGGALMLNVDLLNAQQEALATSKRPVLMQYRSWPVKVARWLALTPFYLLGILEEAQTHTFVLFDSYVESTNHPLSYIRVELSDPSVQVSKGDVFVIAELSGLAYLMYHWFVFSAVAGTFLCWLVVVGSVGVLGCVVYCSGGDRGDTGVEEGDGAEGSEGHGGRRRSRSPESRRGRSRSPLNEQDFRGKEYVPVEERGGEFKED